MLQSLETFFSSTMELPFNTTALAKQFQLLSPQRDDGAPGYWLLLRGLDLLVAEEQGRYVLPFGDCPCAGGDALLIGRWQNKPCRLLAVDADIAVPEGLTIQSLRADDERMSIELLSLAGIGNMINHWEQSSFYCSNCSAELERLPTNWGKTCPACGVQHFPRIHPCVIGMIVKEDKILLARRPGFPDGRYSLIAGFVDMGENLEEAMMREAYEEVGLQITNIRYLGSQCWPFPSQLMCGFVADYAGGEIELLDGELEHATWFGLDELPTIAPKRSIARYIIDRAAEYVTAK